MSAANTLDDLSVASQLRRVPWATILLGLVAAYGIGLLLALLVSMLGWWPGATWEQDVLHAAQRTVSPTLDMVMLVLPFFGTNYSLAPVVVVVAIVLWDKRLAVPALHLLVVQAGSIILNPALKFSVPRDRPALYEQRGQHAFPAFPSGHSIAVAAVMLTGAYLLYRYHGSTWGFWLVGIFFVLNSYSRIYLSVHWPTDLIGGTIVGLIWFFACVVAFRPLHRGPEPGPGPEPEPEP